MDGLAVATAILATFALLYLNTQSWIVVEIEQGVRAIALKSGEAFFEVAHEKECPFIVKTRNG